jgi:hypothetical protein
MPYQDDDELFDTFLNEDEEEDKEGESNDDEFLEPEEPEGKDWEEE